MKTAEIRRAYLSFFEARGHRVAPSSPLVPHDDPTLLFANAGMNQFKDALLGREDLGFKRAASAQKCVRAGGKHNDLENVGYTARHLTFFEMLGNFSFGDYFKEESIAWAWEFATKALGLAPERLWATAHPSDGESRSLWLKLAGLPPERVVDHEDNFWAMGDTGPCGPCTELFYDQGPEIPGGPPGSPEQDGDRYIEFWNLVFPQFDRSPDGVLAPLPRPGVDTGMGLERMATVLEPLDGGALEAVRELGARFEQALAREFESDGLGGDGLRFRYEVDARYFGQYHEITIAVPKGAGRAAVQRLFEEKFLREFGRLDAGRSVELVNFRLIGEAPVRIPALARAGGCFADTAEAAATRPVFVRDGFADCPVFQRAALGAGARLAGPLILEEMSATLFVPPGWRLGGGTCGELLLTREKRNRGGWRSDV